MTDLSVNLAGVTLKNPIVVASGTYGFGHEFAEFYDLSELGAICAKGLTVHKKDGNPPPRIAETPAGILNSVGLQNPGVDAFCEQEMPYLKKSGTKIIANISGNTLEEFTELAEKVSAAGGGPHRGQHLMPQCKARRLGLGHPAGLCSGGHRSGQKGGYGAGYGKAFPQCDRHYRNCAGSGGGRRRCTEPHQHPAWHAHRHRDTPAYPAQQYGWTFRSAVLPVAVRMIYQVANAVKLPILGMGGVATGADAVEMMMAGATAVAVGTGLLCRPLCAAQGARWPAQLSGAAQSGPGKSTHQDGAALLNF